MTAGVGLECRWPVVFGSVWTTSCSWDLPLSRGCPPEWPCASGAGTGCRLACRAVCLGILGWPLGLVEVIGLIKLVVTSNRFLLARGRRAEVI